MKLRRKIEDADEIIKKQNAQLQTMYQKWIKKTKGDQAEEEIRLEKATSLIKDSVGLGQADGGQKSGVVDKLENGGTGHGIDVVEMYSEPRVTPESKKFGMKAGLAMDLKTGWDFSKEEDRERARK